MSVQVSIYDPGHAVFDGGATHSVLHPVVIGAIVLIAILVFLLPRRLIIVPLLLGILLIPAGQNLYVAGNHVYVYRILLLFGWVRLLGEKLSSSEKLLPKGFDLLDKIFLAWAAYRALAVVLLYSEVSAIPNQVAFLWGAIGGYFLFRCLIRSEEDVLRVVKTLAVVAVVVAIAMVYEQETRRNMFGFLGGISPIPDVRNGRIRSQGAFQQPLLAGAFGATMFVWFVWLWKRNRSWFLGILGTVSSVIIAYTSATSTSVLALAGGIGAIFLWPIRERMRWVRWGIVGGIAVLQVVMRAPFWFVMAHIDVAGGSSGWDRANLIDQFIRHFGEWFLIGTHDNVNWAWDMWDTCNQFITEGVTGGLVCFVLFITMFVICFKRIGNARKAAEGDRNKEWLCWLVGAALFSQVLAFFGIDYFDQMIFVWYALLAMITAVTIGTYSVPATEPQPTLPASALRGRWQAVFNYPQIVPRSSTPLQKRPFTSR